MRVVRGDGPTEMPVEKYAASFVIANTPPARATHVLGSQATLGNAVGARGELAHGSSGDASSVRAPQELIATIERSKEILITTIAKFRVKDSSRGARVR
jgi:hypothetical protein